MICLEILYIVLKLGHSAFKRVRTLDDVVMLVHLFFKLSESVLRQLACRDDA